MDPLERGPYDMRVETLSLTGENHARIEPRVAVEIRKNKRARNKILMVLSSKSSGSSAMQKYLALNFGAHSILHTEHFEQESLFWTKAASVLSLPQDEMCQSEVPIPASQAAERLQRLLKDNKINASISGQTAREEFFELFYRLCRNTGFPVVEKSPHHLFNTSNVQLILEFKKYIAPRADVVLIGLVRNPIDTIYSGWTRWRFNCQAFEHEWYSTYQNLRILSEQENDIAIFRYEDLSKSSSSFDEFLSSRCGLRKLSDQYSFNEKSVQKWKKDGLFQHTFSPETANLASELGYISEELKLEKEISIWLTIREFLHGIWLKWKKLRKSWS